MNKRLLKDLLYKQVARVGKAVSSPKRLELLELLAQEEKSVETLATELTADVKLTSGRGQTNVRHGWRRPVFLTSNQSIYNPAVPITSVLLPDADPLLETTHENSNHFQP